MRACAPVCDYRHGNGDADRLFRALSPHQRGRFHALSHRYRLVSLLQRLIRLKMEAIRESMGPMALHYLEHVTSSNSVQMGLYRRDINLSPPRNNRFIRREIKKVSAGECRSLAERGLAMKRFHPTHFFISNKYFEAKRSVYTKEGGHFGGLLTQAGGISYSTVSPAVHFLYSSGPGREGVKLNQRCPPSCKAPTLDHKK